MLLRVLQVFADICPHDRSNRWLPLVRTGLSHTSHTQCFHGLQHTDRTMAIPGGGPGAMGLPKRGRDLDCCKS